MSIALIVFLPLLGALLAPLAIRYGRNACAATAGAASLAAFALLMSHLPGVYAGEVGLDHGSARGLAVADLLGEFERAELPEFAHSTIMSHA